MTVSPALPAVLSPPVSAWTRRHDRALLAGVCEVLARQLGVRPLAVRVMVALPVLLIPPALLQLVDVHARWGLLRALLLLAAPAVLGYLALWWALPDDAARQREDALRENVAAVRGMPAGRSDRMSRPTADASGRPDRSRALPAGLRWLGLATAVGTGALLLLLTAGVDLLAVARGVALPDAFFVQGAASLAAGLAFMAAAVAFGLMPLGDLDRARWSGLPAGAPVGALLALGAALSALVLGALALAAMIVGGAAAILLLLAVLATTGLLAILLVPWGRRLWRGIREESAQRAVMAHHRETIAHLHDSVLQTLAVLQRPGIDADEARRLARIQERELRRWLYRDGVDENAAHTDLRTAVEALTEEVEDDHAAQISTVVVGDAPLAERMRPLLGALREATVNACRHGREEVDVFVDVRPQEIQAFVRDRGPGFDLDAVPADRLGVRESIIGRMQRAGGTAHVRPAPGGGTEVALSLPRTAA
ncbi:ATP-binding protein [Brachybacterium sp. DNPG3]